MNRAELADFAEQRFYQLRVDAKKAVAAGKVAPDVAEVRVRDWLAIAFHAGAELKEFSTEVHEHSFAVRHFGRFIEPQPYQLPEAEARASVAKAYTPDGRWRLRLARERDSAVSAAAQNEQAAAYAQAIVELCDALQVGPTPPPAAQQREPVRQAA